MIGCGLSACYAFRRLTMIQTYTMVFWLNNKHRGADEISQIIYDLFGCLNCFDHRILPRYRTARSKRAAQEVETSIQHLRNMISADITRLKSPDNVYSISFFSSMDEDDSLGLTCAFGNLPTQSCNAIIMQLPISYETFFPQTDQIYLLFQRLTDMLRPYYSFVKNNKDPLAVPLWNVQTNKPSSVHWINYYSMKTAEDIGMKCFKRIPQAEFTPDGIYLRIFDKPFDVENIAQLKSRSDISKKLGLL